MCVSVVVMGGSWAAGHPLCMHPKQGAVGGLARPLPSCAPSAPEPAPLLPPWRSLAYTRWCCRRRTRRCRPGRMASPLPTCPRTTSGGWACRLLAAHLVGIVHALLPLQTLTCQADTPPGSVPPSPLPTARQPSCSPAVPSRLCPAPAAGWPRSSCASSSSRAPRCCGSSMPR